jgi:hypothetical protein
MRTRNALDVQKKIAGITKKITGKNHGNIDVTHILTKHIESPYASGYLSHAQHSCLLPNIACAKKSIDKQQLITKHPPSNPPARKSYPDMPEREPILFGEDARN